MSKQEFIEYIAEKIELDEVSISLLGNVYDYVKDHNHTVYNWTLQELLKDLFGLTIEDLDYLCERV